MTSGDIVAVAGAVTTLITAVAGAITLIRRHSDEMSKRDQQEAEDCSAWKRSARRVIRQLRDILSEHGIPEPEGLDGELAGGRAGEKAE